MISMIRRCAHRRRHKVKQIGMAFVQTASRFFSMAPDRITAEEEAYFFTWLKTGNATFKRTQAGRFRDVDSAMLLQIEAAGGRLDAILDIGISSGTTTLELLDAARTAGHDTRITATDRSLAARLVNWPLGFSALLEPDGHILQYGIFGRPLRAWRRRLDYVTGMALVQKLAQWTIGRAARRAAMKKQARDVALVSPRLAGTRGVELVEDDVTRGNAAFESRFDLVRAANILNRDYFDEKTLSRAAGNLMRYLRGEGSWLFIIRTHEDGQQNGTLFRRQGNGLAVAHRFGRGSEIETLVLESCIPSASPERTGVRVIGADELTGNDGADTFRLSRHPRHQ